MVKMIIADAFANLAEANAELANAQKLVAKANENVERFRDAEARAEDVRNAVVMAGLDSDTGIDFEELRRVSNLQTAAVFRLSAAEDALNEAKADLAKAFERAAAEFLAFWVVAATGGGGGGTTGELQG